VSGDGGMLAFTTQSLDRSGSEDTAWVLPTGSAPGSITARARKIYDHSYMPGRTATVLDSALISPDGSTLYLATTATSPGRKAVAAVTAYRTTNGATLGTISTWPGGYPEMLAPVGDMVLAWAYTSTAYLINPATRTRTTLLLRGFPGAQYAELAW
jgi:hypothetical protein